MKLQDIDFRIWNGLREHYVRDHLYVDEEDGCGKTNFCIAQGKVLVVDNEREVVDIIIDCDVEFFTGFKDSMGIKIYEGDIVRFGIEEEVYRYIVKFENGDFKAISCEDGEVIPISIFKDPKYSTVLGNIHEDPELLGSKKGKEITKRS